MLRRLTDRLCVNLSPVEHWFKCSCQRNVTFAKVSADYRVAPACRDETQILMDELRRGGHQCKSAFARPSIHQNRAAATSRPNNQAQRKLSGIYIWRGFPRHYALKAALKLVFRACMFLGGQVLKEALHECNRRHQVTTFVGHHSGVARRRR